MKIKTALKTLLFSTVILLLSTSFFSRFVIAQTLVPLDSGEVEVNANINVDFYSQLSLSPTTVEILQPSTVNITAVNFNGTPRVGRNIVIYIQGNSTGVTITQPTVVTNSLGKTSGTVRSSVPGSYVVCAKDTTEGYDIFIQDCETLYVIPVPAPTMLEEPEYTKGNSNTVAWNTGGSGVYNYYAEVSTTSDFSVIKDNSGWMPNLTYEFSDLEDGQMYFYRVKARNTYGGESGWSNTVFSVQDAQGPEITLISISDIEENTNVDWDRNFVISIRYRITDNVQVKNREFWCIRSDGSRHDCIYTATEDGDFWDISIQLKYLEKTASGNLFDKYEFCVEATDVVNNVSRNCKAKIEVPVEKPEDEIPPPIIPRVPLITRIRERLEKVFDDTLLRFKEFDMTDITVVVTVINVLVGLGVLLTALGYLPHFFIQVGLWLMSLLGFRKKGKVSGYVYDSVTKEPISQAVVRVFTEVHELVWTSITDSNGYFKTIDMEDAEYHIKVEAKGYTFPSKIVFGKTDFPLDNVYHGDPFLTREEKIPDFSIPMDSVDIKESRKKLARFLSRTKPLWKIFQLLLFVFGLVLTIYATFTTPIWWNFVMLSLYIIPLAALWYSFFARKNKYGFVRDTESKEVEGAIIGLNEGESEKLVSKRVTDKLGRYRFVVRKGVYSLSILNSDLKTLNQEKYSALRVEEEGGELLAPNITVKRLEDEVKDEEIIEPLDEL
jgi:hypothetical protein